MPGKNPEVVFYKGVEHKFQPQKCSCVSFSAAIEIGNRRGIVGLNDNLLTAQSRTPC